VITTLCHVQFGSGINGRRRLMSGLDSKRHTWWVGKECSFRLNCAPAKGDLQLELRLMPFVSGPQLRTQRIEISVNGQLVGWERIGAPTWLGFRLPRGEFNRTSVFDIHLHCPDATTLASLGKGTGTRELGFMLSEALLLDIPQQAPFAPRGRGPLPLPIYTGSKHDLEIVRAVTALSPADLALSFEGIGTNCEFGLFQRECGVEPLGLLRFAGMSYPDLVGGLDSGFVGIEDRSTLTCRIEGAIPEWIIRSEPYGLEYHTQRRPSEVSVDAVLYEQCRTLPFRRSKLLDLLSTGEKLFVVMGPEGMTSAQALPLLSVLRSYGPNALLFVSGQTGYPAGTVRALARDLFCGSLDGVVKGAGDQDRPGRKTWLSDAALTAWMSVCAGAYRFWREEGGGGADARHLASDGRVRTRLRTEMRSAGSAVSW
jgi:hypothetical protein